VLFLLYESLSLIGLAAIIVKGVVIHEVTENIPKILPRGTDEIGIKVIYERNKNFASEYMKIRREKVINALKWLKSNNSMYSDIEINELLFVL
jgi:hypothetical protein